MVNTLPAPRRVVTSHNPAGQAVVWLDNEIAMQEVPGSTIQAGLAWFTEDSPANVQTDIDGATIKPPGITHPTGSVLNYVDLPPHASFPLHFTTSIDYGIVLKGETVMELSDGSCTTVKAGDVIVQRGTVHAWHNRTEEWLRILFVVLPALPVSIDGKPLEGLHL